LREFADHVRPGSLRFLGPRFIGEVARFAGLGLFAKKSCDADRSRWFLLELAGGVLDELHAAALTPHVKPYGDPRRHPKSACHDVMRLPSSRRCTRPHRSLRIGCNASWCGRRVEGWAAVGDLGRASDRFHGADETRWTPELAAACYSGTVVTHGCMYWYSCRYYSVFEAASSCRHRRPRRRSIRRRAI